jgi:hypothetical protein
VGDAVPRVPPTDEVPVEAYKSKSEWIGWGGVKWCLEKDFQKLLNREGWQSGEPDAVAPRVYASFKFEPMKGSIGCPSHNVAKAVLSDVGKPPSPEESSAAPSQPQETGRSHPASGSCMRGGRPLALPTGICA